MHFTELRCQRLYPTPFLSISCPTGYRYGSKCEFACDVGSQLNGTIAAVCERNSDALYAAWTFGVNQPFCKGKI